MSLENFKPDKYQIAIREAFVNTEQHLFIAAAAGSGKTTTLTYLMQHIKKGTPSMSLAFSKRIQLELQSRVPSHVGSLTLHSYGFSTLRANGIDKLEKWKVGRIIKDLGMSRELVQPLKDLTSLYKNTLNSDFEYLIENFNVDLPKNTDIKNLTTLVQKILIEDVRLAQEKGICDYDDQLWLPIRLDLNLPTYDLIFLDETQDLNATQIALVLQASRNGGRVIATGDKKQSIFSFRAADPLSIDNLISALGKTARGSQILPLSISYRCSKKVVELAQTLVPSIEASLTAPEGSVRHHNVKELKSSLSKLKVSHLQPIKNMRKFMILSRTNAPLMSWYMLLQKLKLPISFRSNLMSSQLQELISKCNNFSRATISEACNNLIRHAKQVSNMMPNQLSRDAFSDKIGILVTILTNTPQVSENLVEYYQKIDKLIEEKFNNSDTLDSKHDTILLSTIHCAKGLEAENVFIIRPDLIPHPMAKKPLEIEQEENIQYVAITRTAINLYFIEGKEDPLELETA